MWTAVISLFILWGVNRMVKNGDDREKRENGPFWTFQILNCVYMAGVEGV